ncbi:hypothetical protein E0Z10_g3094 [Xylaria hypoxylon]|uniref:Uncharacterized protein n=1 Tax=Xylaria hypoxylon TaxID=37992 RepID=A0A4Z0YMZ7_9PEZI|nr:hypothetical protein E0Z10_g3094 [Xylaria hypoxylon]
MLTKIIIAGLIPGMMAKPIMLSRSGTSAVHHAASTPSALSSWAPSVKAAFSTATPNKREDDDLVDFEVDAGDVERRQPGNAGSYPVVAVPSVISSVSALTTPVVLPSVLPSKAIDTPQVLPAVVSNLPNRYPVVKPLTSATIIPTPLVQLPYNVKTPAVQIDVPTATPTFISSFPVLPYTIKTPAVQPALPTYPVVAPQVQLSSSSSSVQLPYSVKTPAVLAELPYGVKTPVILPELPKTTFSAVVTSSTLIQVPYSVKTPTVLAELPYSVKTPEVLAELPYGVKTPVVVPELPRTTYPAAVVSVVSSTPVQLPYSVKTPAVLPELPYGVKTPAVLPELPYGVKTPAVLPEVAYGVKTSAALPDLPYGVKTPAVLPEITKATYPAAVSAVAAVSTPIELPYDVKEHTAATAATILPVKASAVPETHMPSVKTDPSVPAGSSACAEECEIKCQTAHIAADVTQCRTSCLSGCASGSTDGVRVGVADDRKDKAKSKGASAVPGLGASGLGASGPGIGIGSVTFESCMQSCNGRFQHADIAGDVSTGKESCKTACAKYSSSGTSVIVKRKFKDLVPSEPVVGAGATTYEACMKGCVAKWRDGGVGCEERCAASTLYGATVVIKKSVEEDPASIKRDIKDLIPGGPVAGVGRTSFETCVKSCNGRFQHADIAGDISTGREKCEAACASYAAKGAGVIVKKALPPPNPFPFPAAKPVIDIGTTSYDACVSDCSSKYQSAHIAMDVSTGKYSCKQACAHLEHSGVGVITKKEALPHQVNERKVLPTPKLPTLPPLPHLPIPVV